MYSEADSSLNSAAWTICAHVSSSMRKYRLGVCPVAGLPRARGAFDGVSITVFYVHPKTLSICPENLKSRVIYGWTSSVTTAFYRQPTAKAKVGSPRPGGWTVGFPRVSMGGLPRFGAHPSRARRAHAMTQEIQPCNVANS